MLFNRLKTLDYIDKLEQKIILKAIHNPLINEFNSYYRRLSSEINNINLSELNREFNHLKRYFSLIKTSIVPYEELKIEDIYESLNYLFESIVQNSGDENIENLLMDFGKMIGQIKNGIYENKLPIFINQILSEYPKDNRVALVGYHWTGSQSKIFGRSVKTLTLRNYLTNFDPFDVVIFLGTPYYYTLANKYVTTINKSKDTFFLYYDIYEGVIKHVQIIENNNEKFSNLISHYEVIKNHPNKLKIKLEKEDDVFLSNQSNQVEMKEIAKRFSSEHDSAVTAYSFQLESGQIILYPKNGSVYSVNKDNLKVARLKTTKVSEGDWIIVKKVSEETYLDEKASELIEGDYYSKFNEVTSYKQLLKERKEKIGTLRGLLLDLQTEGITTTEQLLKNWLYGDTIAPEKYEDLLRYLGFGEMDVEYLKNTSREINSARIRAGRELMKSINDLIREYRVEEILNEIDSNSNFEFTIPGVGVFVLEIIKYKSKETIEVETKSLYRLLDFNSNKSKKILGNRFIL